jgi:hypothetical protein
VLTPLTTALLLGDGEFGQQDTQLPVVLVLAAVAAGPLWQSWPARVKRHPAPGIGFCFADARQQVGDERIAACADVCPGDG